MLLKHSVTGKDMSGHTVRGGPLRALPLFSDFQVVFWQAWQVGRKRKRAGRGELISFLRHPPATCLTRMDHTLGRLIFEEKADTIRLSFRFIHVHRLYKKVSHTRRRQWRRNKKPRLCCWKREGKGGGTLNPSYAIRRQNLGPGKILTPVTGSAEGTKVLVVSCF